jgi:tetratricopeptide (TPR) repeat protein
MPTLRIDQKPTQADRHLVSVTLRDDNGEHSADAAFAFRLSTQQQERFRWYLEDYLQYPQDPAPNIARSVEADIARIGTELFKAVFQANDQARDLWAVLRGTLNDTRVEVATGVREAAAIPWELLRDPTTDVPLALRAQAFVRTHTQAAQRPRLPKKGKRPIRILLVICRPGGRTDVPFRSVAGRLLKAVGTGEQGAVHLDLLRPPTFEQLGKVLRKAKDDGKPYHVVHFDGHGVVFDVEDLFKGSEKKLADADLRKTLESLLEINSQTFSPATIYPRPRRQGSHGYLAFENPGSAENLRLVDGPELAALLVETEVPVLLLNACRSAHANPPPVPAEGQVAADVHSQVRSLGSLALEAIDAGVAGVVAMRYNVYVVTAAQFVADLYAALAQGQALGEAVSLGRKQLHDQPLREIAFAARPLQDWPVPVVYEAAPIELFPRPKKAPALKITVQDAAGTPGRGQIDPDLPARPDAGFFGRDETLLALDRASDGHAVVLLHAYAGAGKTSTAAEFARWYAMTGGVEGPVLFTSFEQYKPLPRVLDHLGQLFNQALEASGIQWLALDDARRREVALQLLRQVPVLWVWDNVEPVTGFPAGNPSAWTEAEQKELLDFLRQARETKAKFLLTSRRDERGWLGDLPARVAVPPMPFQERVQLARALAQRHGRRLEDVEDWRPLLEFTEGNPLTITAVVGHALREGCRTGKQVEELVARLREGELPFDDEPAEGRAKSLGASLNYGFEKAFAEEERKQLALLHLFQGFVDVDALALMGKPDTSWRVLEVRGLTREAGLGLLDRAAEVGLLTALGGGYYRIHPAVPWFFRSPFQRHYPITPGGGEGPGLGAARAFVEAMGELGNIYHNLYELGHRDMIGVLGAEEANLLQARRLARRYVWWGTVTSTMQGLQTLYEHTGRQAEWRRLVEEVVPDFTDPATDGPLRGREGGWGFVIGYRTRLAIAARDWPEAERLLRLDVNQGRQQVAPVLAADSTTWDPGQCNAIRSLAVSLHQLGHLQTECRQPECAVTLQEALSLSERIGDQEAAVACAVHLGHAYLDVAPLRSLEQAEHWYKQGLGMCEPHGKHAQAKCLMGLGRVSQERFDQAVKAGQPEAERRGLLNESLRYYGQALDLTPPDAVSDLAVIHNQLGGTYHRAADVNGALPHYRQSIRYKETQGNLYGAAQTRFNVALLLANADRFQEALQYAQAALKNYEQCGDSAAGQIQKTRELIQAINQALHAQGG